MIITTLEELRASGLHDTRFLSPRQANAMARVQLNVLARYSASTLVGETRLRSTRSPATATQMGHFQQVLGSPPSIVAAATSYGYENAVTGIREGHSVPVADPSTAVAIHEWAHVVLAHIQDLPVIKSEIEYRVGQAIGFEFPIPRNLGARMPLKAQVAVRIGLSSYATTNYAEFLAEAMTEWLSLGGRAGTIAQAVGQSVDRYLRFDAPGSVRAGQILLDGFQQEAQYIRSLGGRPLGVADDRTATSIRLDAYARASQIREWLETAEAFTSASRSGQELPVIEPAALMLRDQIAAVTVKQVEYDDKRPVDPLFADWNDREAAAAATIQLYNVSDIAEPLRDAPQLDPLAWTDQVVVDSDEITEYSVEAELDRRAGQDRDSVRATASKFHAEQGYRAALRGSGVAVNQADEPEPFSQRAVVRAGDSVQLSGRADLESLDLFDFAHAPDNVAEIAAMSLLRVLDRYPGEGLGGARAWRYVHLEHMGPVTHVAGMDGEFRPMALFNAAHLQHALWIDRTERYAVRDGVRVPGPSSGYEAVFLRAALWPVADAVASNPYVMEAIREALPAAGVEQRILDEFGTAWAKLRVQQLLSRAAGSSLVALVSEGLVEHLTRAESAAPIARVIGQTVDRYMGRGAARAEETAAHRLRTFEAMTAGRDSMPPALLLAIDGETLRSAYQLEGRYRRGASVVDPSPPQLSDAAPRADVVVPRVLPSVVGLDVNLRHWRDPWLGAWRRWQSRSIDRPLPDLLAPPEVPAMAVKVPILQGGRRIDRLRTFHAAMGAALLRSREPNAQRTLSLDAAPLRIYSRSRDVDGIEAEVSLRYADADVHAGQDLHDLHAQRLAPTLVRRQIDAGRELLGDSIPAHGLG